jgi:hypothetical protein
VLFISSWRSCIGRSDAAFAVHASVARAAAKKLATRAAGGITGAGAKQVNPVYKNTGTVKVNSNPNTTPAKGKKTPRVHPCATPTHAFQTYAATTPKPALVKELQAML